MVDRDHDAFMRFIADDAVFLNGGKPLRGKATIGAHWQQFFTSPAAPFTWKPELVEVVDSGGLAQSIGPVTAPDGKVKGTSKNRMLVVKRRYSRKKCR